MERAGIKGTYLNIIKAIYSKPTANIKLNGEKLRVIPVKLGKRQGCSLSLYLFNVVRKVPARSTGYKLERKKLNFHYLKMI